MIRVTPQLYMNTGCCGSCTVHHLWPFKMSGVISNTSGYTGLLASGKSSTPWQPRTCAYLPLWYWFLMKQAISTGHNQCWHAHARTLYARSVRLHDTGPPHGPSQTTLCLVSSGETGIIRNTSALSTTLQFLFLASCVFLSSLLVFIFSPLFFFTPLFPLSSSLLCQILSTSSSPCRQTAHLL